MFHNPSTEKQTAARHRATDSRYAEYVDVRVFQEAFRESGMSLSDLARELEFMRPDECRAGRMLGIHKTDGRYRERMSPDNAELFGRVLNLDPIDWE